MADLNSLKYADVESHLVKTKWDLVVRTTAVLSAFWTKFTGAESSNMPIIEKTNLKKGAGKTLKVTVMSEFENAGVEGESTLESNEGERTTGQMDVTLDFVRNAEAATSKARFFSFEDRLKTAAPAMGRWYARKRDWHIFKQLIATESPDIVYGGAATASNALDESCKLGAAEAERIGLALDRKGAMPFEVKEKNGYVTPMYGFVIDRLAYYHLRADNAYNTACETVGVRGKDNPIWTGVPHIYAGMIIIPYRMIGGKRGSPLRPEARVLSTHNNSIQTITVGTAATKIYYTEYFDDTGTLSIINADGEKEFVTYTGKTDYSFTGCTRGDSYGSLDSDGASAYTGDEIITQGNLLSRGIAFGAEICISVKGQPVKHILQAKDYDFVKGVGIEAIHGQKAVEDVDGNTPNYVLGNFYANNPNRKI